MKDLKLLTPKQVAEILHCSRSMVYKLVNIGQIRAYKPGKIVRIDQQDLFDYIKRTRIIAND